MFVGGFGQAPVMLVSPGLVQFNMLPPAGPETASVPVQRTAPFIAVALNVNVPEKLVVVVAPETVPLNPPLAHVPKTELPASVRFIVNGMLAEAPEVCPVNSNVPDQFPATLADVVGAVGVLLPPHAHAEIRSRTTQPRLNISISAPEWD